MECVYAALLLHTAGKKIDETGLTNVLKAAGANVDEARVKALVTALKDVDIDEAVRSAAAPAAAPAAPAAPAKVKEKKEEVEEKKEEALTGLAALFE